MAPLRLLPQVLLLAISGRAQAHEHHPFVPGCIARHCAKEARALSSDEYTKALASCISEGFEPCAGKAWDCLGDKKCRSVLSCGPDILGTCDGDIWKVLTDPKERERLMCLSQCEKEGSLDPICAVLKCGKAALGCVQDPACRGAALCLPRTVAHCTEEFAACDSEDCRENLRCLGHGLGGCSEAAVNLFTDTRIADLVDCASQKCPRPEDDPHEQASLVAAPPAPGVPAMPAAEDSSTGALGQLLCIASQCGHETLEILADQDTENLLHCALDGDLGHLCSSIWECLGDEHCAQAVHCWSEPFGQCEEEVWHLLTDRKQRERLERNAACLHGCDQAHSDDFVEGAFCVMDHCAQDLLACRSDKLCWKAVQCLPRTLEACAMPTLEAYEKQHLFRDSVKCLGQGLETCGRRAVAMLQDQNVSKAVRCASKCTRKPDIRMETAGTNVEVVV